MLRCGTVAGCLHTAYACSVDVAAAAAPAAFRSGAVMGFLLAGFGLLNLFLGIMLFKWVSLIVCCRALRSRHGQLGNMKRALLVLLLRCGCACTRHSISLDQHAHLVEQSPLLLLLQAYGDNWRGIFESITGYGLGGSSIALFGRVGGGIYTKVRHMARLPLLALCFLQGISRFGQWWLSCGLLPTCSGVAVAPFVQQPCRKPVMRRDANTPQARQLVLARWGLSVSLCCCCCCCHYTFGSAAVGC